MSDNSNSTSCTPSPSPPQPHLNPTSPPRWHTRPPMLTTHPPHLSPRWPIRAPSTQCCSTYYLRLTTYDLRLTTYYLLLTTYYLLLTQVAYKGPVDAVLLDFFGGLRSACTCAHTRAYMECVPVQCPHLPPSYPALLAPNRPRPRPLPTLPCFYAPGTSARRRSRRCRVARPLCAQH